MRFFLMSTNQTASSPGDQIGPSPSWAASAHAHWGETGSVMIVLQQRRTSYTVDDAESERATRSRLLRAEHDSDDCRQRERHEETQADFEHNAMRSIGTLPRRQDPCRDLGV